MNEHYSNTIASPHVNGRQWEVMLSHDADGLEGHTWVATHVLRSIWSKVWPLALFAAGSMTN